jgi:hypothetical protein
MPQYLTPAGAIVEEVGSFQALTPFGAILNESFSGAGSVDLAGAAAAAATGQGALSVQALLAANAVAGALGSGALSVNVPLTAAAIASAVGSAALDVFDRVWRIPTNAPGGTTAHVFVYTGTAPNYTILAQGPATAAGGFFDLPSAGSPGAKAGALMWNWDDDTDSIDIDVAAGIATVTDL